MTDVAKTEQLLRIIQSIPSPKAEPFKVWLAQVGRERIEETIDPKQAIDRALETYMKKGTRKNGCVSVCCPSAFATNSPTSDRSVAWKGDGNMPFSLTRSPVPGLE